MSFLKSQRVRNGMGTKVVRRALINFKSLPHSRFHFIFATALQERYCTSPSIYGCLERWHHELCDPADLGLEARLLTVRPEAPPPQLFLFYAQPHRQVHLLAWNEGDPEICIQNHYFISVPQYLHNRVKQMAHLQIIPMGRDEGFMVPKGHLDGGTPSRPE